MERVFLMLSAVCTTRPRALSSPSGINSPRGSYQATRGGGLEAISTTHCNNIVL